MRFLDKLKQTGFAGKATFAQERWLGIAFTGILLTAGLFQFPLNDLEATLYDLRIAGATLEQNPNEIVLVTLDDRTTRSFDELAPLPLDHHVRLLEALSSLKPKSIGWILDLNRAHQAAPGLLLTGTGRKFIDTVANFEAQGGSFILGTTYDIAGEIPAPFPLSELDHGVALIHKDGNVFAEDKVTRRALWSLSGRPSFHALMARKLGDFSDGHSPLGTFPLQEAHSEYFFFRWNSNPAQKPLELREGDIPLSDARTFKEGPWKWISWLDLINGAVPPEAIKNKIVLVGEVSKQNSLDFAFTPWSRKSFTNPKLAVHANILDSLLSDRTIIPGSKWIAAAVTLVGVTFVVAAVVTSTPIQGLLATVGLALGFLLVTHLIFISRGLWVPSAHTLIGFLTAYYLAVPYRLFREYRARWDYQKQNEILTQVEEMKRNFVSLVTHDLKTPVARIQGLAEVVSRKAADRLNERDQESLRHIIDSTDELNRFISSILELSRIDSARDFALSPESKDINQLIERAVERFKAPARSRGVHIELSLEPQFPIRFDVQLVTRVLHNLIDNAIKYSKEGGTLRVRTLDWDGGVEIQISDNGIGIGTEDLEKLFSRFHRAKNDITTRITGTGLGLYLSKYFIAAHGGTLTVASRLHEGSTFTIRLPAEPRPPPQPSPRKRFQRPVLTVRKEQSHA